MKTVELLKERYPDHIADEYSESRELSLAQFNGHDMIEFAEYYHKQISCLPSSIQEALNSGDGVYRP